MFLQESKCDSGASPRSVASAEAAEGAASASAAEPAELQDSLPKKKLPHFEPATTSPSAPPPKASADRPSLLALAVKRQHLQQMLLGFFVWVTGGVFSVSSHGI